MKNNKSLIIILVFTFILAAIILLLSSNKKYNKYVVSNNTYENIKSKKENKKIKINSIKFNDYSLFIDEEESIIYYSIVDGNNMYNPSIKYKTNEKAKLAINKELDANNIERNDVYKMIIYDNNYYHEYSLCMTIYPLMNIISKEGSNSVTVQLFDNHINRHQKYIESKGIMKKIDNDKYTLNLKQESLGHNRRDNPLSILGIERTDEYIIEKSYNMNEKKKYIRLFLNNKYQGMYIVNSKQNVINGERE